MKAKYTPAQLARHRKAAKAKLRRDLAALTRFIQLNARKMLAGKYYAIGVTVFDTRGNGLAAQMVRNPPPPPPFRAFNRDDY